MQKIIEIQIICLYANESFEKQTVQQIKQKKMYWEGWKNSMKINTCFFRSR